MFEYYTVFQIKLYYRHGMGVCVCVCVCVCVSTMFPPKNRHVMNLLNVVRL